MSGLRNWLMHIIAGRRYAYWIADDAAKGLLAGRNVPGEIGAIMLAKAMDEMGATSATITLGGYEISIRATLEPKP